MIIIYVLLGITFVLLLIFVFRYYTLKYDLKQMKKE